MKKNILILTIMFIWRIRLFSQVGIGGIPNANSILDLSNSSKSVQLPVATVVPTPATLDTVGAMIYFNGNIYLRTPSGIKVFTPWKWNGSDVISSASSNPVGIGIVPVSNSNRLVVASASASGASISSTASASIAVGNTSAPHLLIDEDEIMEKNNLTTSGTLNFQREEGVVAINLSSTSTNATVLKANGSIDATQLGKIKENGDDLVPVGSIAMWNQTVIPAGWALCDGSTYTRVDGGSIVAPDLRSRFIVGAGGDNPLVGGPLYITGDTGGSVSNFHTHSFDPPSGISSGNTAHFHSGSTGGPSATVKVCATSSYSVPDNNHAHNFTTGSGTIHSHAIDIPNFNPSPAGGSSVSENRPPYYALIFIIKL